MHVRLRNTFFAGPQYGRFDPAPRRLDTVEIPDELFDILPKTPKSKKTANMRLSLTTTSRTKTNLKSKTHGSNYEPDYREYGTQPYR